MQEQLVEIKGLGEVTEAAKIDIRDRIGRGNLMDG
jgi:hypothetical protein